MTVFSKVCVATAMLMAPTGTDAVHGAQKTSQPSFLPKTMKMVGAALGVHANGMPVLNTRMNSDPIHVSMVQNLGYSHQLRDAKTIAKGSPSSESVKMKWGHFMDFLPQLLKDKKLMKQAFKSFMVERFTPTQPDGQEWGTDEKLPEYISFITNVEAAHTRNIASQGESVHGITGLMAHTPEQFHHLLGAKYPENYRQGVRAEDVLPSRLQNLSSSMPRKSVQVDWRDEDAVSAVKDQGQCGSCWAFSTVEEAESMAYLANQIPTGLALSPQEIVDCDDKGEDQGCDGGLPSEAGKYLSTHGLETERRYPYVSGETEKAGTCKYSPSNGKLTVTGETQVSIWGIGEDEDMKDWISNTGPLSVAVAANNAWQTYTGGVITLDECPDNQPNHAVQAIGLIDNDPEDGSYWIVRNSWNSDWGEEGMIRLKAYDNTCSIAFEGVGFKTAAGPARTPPVEV